jgi:WD40 repeat protein
MEMETMRIETATVKTAQICGQVLLLLLTATLGIAWTADEGDAYWNLVFTKGTRSLVGNSRKYRLMATRPKRGSLPPLEISGAIKFWSVENGKLEDSMQFSPKEYPETIDISPDGELMVVAFWNLRAKGEKYGHSSIACYSLTEKKWAWRSDWPSKFDYAREVKFSPDGLKVAVIGVKNIVFYDAMTGQTLEVISEPLKDYPIIGLSVRGSVLSPSGRYIVVWQEKPPPGHHILGRLIANKRVTVWDLQSRKQLASWRKPEYVNFCAVFTKDEKNILFGSGIDSGGHIRVWSVEKKEIIQNWSLGDIGALLYLKFSDDYRFLAIHAAGKTFDIIICDYPERKEVHRFGDVAGSHEGGPYPMTFFDGSKFFSFTKNDGQVCVYSTQTWKEKWCVGSSPKATD